MRVIGAEVSSLLVDVLAVRVTRGGEMHLLKDALHRCDVVGATGREYMCSSKIELAVVWEGSAQASH